MGQMSRQSLSPTGTLPVTRLMKQQRGHLQTGGTAHRVQLEKTLHDDLCPFPKQLGFMGFCFHKILK